MSSKAEKQIVDCESCQGSGLELPEGNLKYKRQATKMCDKCGGSGKIEVKVEVSKPKPAPKKPEQKSKSQEKREAVMTASADATPGK